MKLTIQEIADLKEGRKTLEEIEAEKCDTPKYIQDLPYDLRTGDIGKLRERNETIKDEIKKTDEEIERLEGVLKKNENSIKSCEDTHRAMGNRYKTHWRFVEKEISKAI